MLDNITIIISLEEFRASSSHHGEVEIPARQVTFRSYFPNGQESKKSSTNKVN